MADWTHPPALVQYAAVEDYRAHYTLKYCAKGAEIRTFDGIRVYFPIGWFDHGFLKSKIYAPGERLFLDQDRAERIDWINWAIENPNAELYQGWLKEKKIVDPTRRVAVVLSSYAVVIQMKQKEGAVIITAFRPTGETLKKIRSNPKWT